MTTLRQRHCTESHFSLSLVKYEKVISSLVKYFTLDDIKIISLKNNSMH